MAVADYGKRRAQLLQQPLEVSDAIATRFAAFLRAKSNGLNFTWKHRTYSYKDCLAIAGLMQSGKVLVGSVRGMPRSTAIYYQSYDFLAVSADIQTPPQTLFNESVVMHEVVHVVNDLRRSNFDKFEDEKTAYLFQAYYLRAYGFNNARDLAGAVNTSLWPTVLAFYDSVADGRPDAGLERMMERQMVAMPEYRNLRHEVSLIDGIVGAPRPGTRR
jgi:hypothetical protein